QINLSLASMIENLDENLGRLLHHLDELGIRQNTFVVFMTDQGVGDRGVMEPFWPGRNRQNDLGNASEGKHRVFCMMQKPGLTVAGENEGIACIRDLLPTVLDVSGLSVPKGIDGRSLVPLLKGQDDWDDERIIVMQCPRGREREKWNHAAVKQGHWRLVSDGRLYDVSVDSLMEKDLSGQHPDLVSRLDAAYEDFWQSLPPRDYVIQRHVLGSREAPSTVLCAMDWREGDAPWNSGALRDGYRGQGSWYVTIKRSGTYRITLCRSMKETPLPIGAVQGKVQLGPFSASREMDVDDAECVLDIELKPGDYRLQSFLSASADGSEAWGANFAYVDFVKPSPRKKPRV
ncbi:MAG: sulfatase-like hydrolase/transferase, partial [Planctomycetota bacterium]